MKNHQKQPEKRDFEEVKWWNLLRMSVRTILDHQFFLKKHIFGEALDPFVSTSCPTEIDPKGPWMILEKSIFRPSSTSLETTFLHKKKIKSGHQKS